ncbi:Methyltransferase domain-containing protein [Jannaschia faecimaris]|uniref:Methyltransferase domain-containing protein n=2 Tax=Jannaschia faecimaris TaxID=1244108 RepID=A0A1H3SHW9_9RHOB|nr:Methyltransferase domain-containing protein [Jannaschia faecimaris]
MTVLYNTIGIDYANLRRADPRIAKQIDAALGDAWSVLNIGAGAGSYEPTGRQVTAIEPSVEMIRQRHASNVRVMLAAAEDLPFRDHTFGAAMAVLTIHHWSDKVAGIRKMRRVTRGGLSFLPMIRSIRDSGWPITFLRW